MGINVKTPQNPVSKNYAKRDDAALYSVHDGDNWESIAKFFDLTARELIYWNFRTHIPEEVNWYLREYVGCTKSRDGKNYSFSRSDNPGVIWFPKSAIIQREQAIAAAIPDTSRSAKIFVLADNYLTAGFLRKNRGGRWAQVHSIGSPNPSVANPNGQVKRDYFTISFTVSDQDAGVAFMQLLDGTVIDVVMFDFERQGTIYHWLKFQTCVVNGFSSTHDPQSGKKSFVVSINFVNVDSPTRTTTKSK